METNGNGQSEVTELVALAWCSSRRYGINQRLSRVIPKESDSCESAPTTNSTDDCLTRDKHAIAGPPLTRIERIEPIRRPRCETTDSPRGCRERQAVVLGLTVKTELEPLEQSVGRFPEAPSSGSSRRAGISDGHGPCSRTSAPRLFDRPMSCPSWANVVSCRDAWRCARSLWCQRLSSPGRLGSIATTEIKPSLRVLGRNESKSNRARISLGNLMIRPGQSSAR